MKVYLNSMEELKIMIEEILQEIMDDVKRLRRDIHRHPEQGYQETGTTERIRDFLERNQVQFYSFRHMTGGYAYIDCKKSRTIGFRADMDALPIQEKTGVKFASEYDGVMHACGHDMHTSIAAGLAVMLNRLRDSLNANVVVVFQPAEECNPTGGAKAVMAQPDFEKLGIQEFYGLHMWPSLKVGEIGVKEGALMASSDKLFIHILGEKAHAAEPQKGVDAISIATEIINAVEHKIRREIEPFDACLISIGEIQSKGRYNIICDDVEIRGTIRAVNEETRVYIRRRIRELSEKIAEAYRGRAEVEIEEGYNIVMNDSHLTGTFIEIAEDVLGKEKVQKDIKTSLIGEDFSFYCSGIPSMYFFAGCDCHYPLHSDRFLPKEETIETALRLMTLYFLTR